MGAAGNTFFRGLFLILCFHYHFVPSYQRLPSPLATTSVQEPDQSYYDSSSSTTSGTLFPSDAAALQSIKTDLTDLPGSTFFSTWSISTSPCADFAGVTCSPDASDPSILRVTALALGTGLADSQGLEGNFPLAITNLTALNQLVLFPGQVSGSLPTNIGDALPSLRFLSITNNLIKGPVPESLSRLHQLHTLDLTGNRLGGSIPYGLFTLPALRTLIVASNGGISGPLPDAVTAPLLHLDVSDNDITGQLPTLLPVCLRYLSASDNAISGSLDAVAALQELTYLDLSNNALTGRIPPCLFSPDVSPLLLHHNNLSGALPAEVPPPSSSGNNTDPSASTTGRTVDISHNMLSGTLTPVLVGADSVSINDNRFVGPVPQDYTRSIYAGTMRTFYAQNNFLTAFPLPPGAAALPPSASVCVSYNCMPTAAATLAGCPATATGDYSAARAPSQCPVFGNATSAVAGGAR